MPYNNNEMKEEKQILRLSDAFEPHEKNSGFEWTATVLNVNNGKNRKILLKCKKLYEYCKFIDKVREFSKKFNGLKKAIEEAINYCIEHNILRDFLIAHKAEVGKMLLTEFNEEKYLVGLQNYYENQVNEANSKAKFEKARADNAEARANKAKINLNISVQPRRPLANPHSTV